MAGPWHGSNPESYGQSPPGPAPASPAWQAAQGGQPWRGAGSGEVGYGGPTGSAAAPAVGGGAPRPALGVSKVLMLAVGALGLINFVAGFLPELSTSGQGDLNLSVFAIGPSYLPIVLLIGGLLAFTTLLPGGSPSRAGIAAVGVGGGVGAVVELAAPGAFEQAIGAAQVGQGLGAVLLVIFGIIQAVVAVGAWVVEAGFVTTGAARGTSPTAHAAGYPTAAGPPAAHGVGGQAGAGYALPIATAAAGGQSGTPPATAGHVGPGTSGGPADGGRATSDFGPPMSHPPVDPQQQTRFEAQPWAQAHSGWPGPAPPSGEQPQPPPWNEPAGVQGSSQPLPPWWAQQDGPQAPPQQAAPWAPPQPSHAHGDPRGAHPHQVDGPSADVPGPAAGAAASGRAGSGPGESGARSGTGESNDTGAADAAGTAGASGAPDAGVPADAAGTPDAPSGRDAATERASAGPDFDRTTVTSLEDFGQPPAPPASPAAPASPTRGAQRADAGPDEQDHGRPGGS